MPKLESSLIKTIFAQILIACLWASALTGAAAAHTKDRELFIEFQKNNSKSPLLEKYAKALNALEHGKHKTAEKLLIELCSKDPNWPGFWTSLGTCYMWSEQFAKGIDCAGRALKLRPKDPDMYNRRALLFVGLLKYDQAVADLNQGLKIDPDDKDMLKLRAKSLKTMKKYPQALADINRLLRLDPSEEAILFVKAEIFEAQQDWKNAIATYTTMLKIFPGDDHVLIKRAAIRMKTKDYKGAVLDYTEALKLGTEAPQFVYEQRALAYEKLGMKEKAARDRINAQRQRSNLPY